MSNSQPYSQAAFREMVAVRDKHHLKTFALLAPDTLQSRATWAPICKSVGVPFVPYHGEVSEDALPRMVCRFQKAIRDESNLSPYFAEVYFVANR